MKFFKPILILLVFIFASQFSFAWGGRGHDAICQSAVYLIKDENLKKEIENVNFKIDKYKAFENKSEGRKWG